MTGLYRHPPVDPTTGAVSAADDAILMGQMRHCDVPPPHRKPGCTALMHDHGWIDNGVENSDGTHGVTVCPDEHWTDEPRTEIEYGINCGDPRECCDPVHITDDPGTASEWMQFIREPCALRREVVTTYGAWEPVDLENL